MEQQRTDAYKLGYAEQALKAIETISTGIIDGTCKHPEYEIKRIRDAAQLALENIK